MIDIVDIKMLLKEKAIKYFYLSWNYSTLIENNKITLFCLELLRFYSLNLQANLYQIILKICLDRVLLIQIIQIGFINFCMILKSLKVRYTEIFLPNKDKIS